MLGEKFLEETVTMARTWEEACQAGVPVTAREMEAGPLPELQRQAEAPPWAEAPQGPGISGKQQQQPATRPGPAPWQWGQPGAWAPTAARRPPGRERTALKAKTRIRKR